MEIEDMAQTIAEKFIQEGKEIGEKQGKLKAKREDILRLLQFRFDDVPPALVKKVKSIRRIDRLDSLFEKAAIAQSISEIETV
jgi:hypothetical protein